MNKKISISILIGFLLISFACTNKTDSEQSIVQWRGDRTGVFNETGLLKSWAENGPELLWHFDGLGEGHSSPAIANGKIYIKGMTDGRGFLFVFDLNGNLLNKIEYGEEWNRNYNGTRGTVTASDGKIYFISGHGVLYCYDQNTLNLVWKKDLLQEFDAPNIIWGITESPLIIGDKIIATPGGAEHNVVALNKHNGELIWSSPGMGERSAYCSPLFIDSQEVPLIVTITHGHIMGLEATTGKLLWAHESRNRNGIHSNTPIYSDGMIFWASVEHGATMLRLTDGGRNSEIVWHIPEWDNMMGGFVKYDGHIYASSSGHRNNGDWFCVEWHTGEIKWQEAGLGASIVILNDGMLYIYTDRGEMVLARATPEKFDIVSRFPITLGTDQHWAHPILYDGVLYVRRGDTLMAYKVR